MKTASLQKLATVMQAWDDVDVLIIATALEISHANTAVVVGDDVHLLVLLMHVLLPISEFFF